MSALRMIYLVLALAGTALPLWSAFAALAQANWAVLAVLPDWRALSDSYYLTVRWDAVVAALSLTVWILAEVTVRRNWSALWVIPAAWLFGVGCGLPLYLFLRTRPVV